MHLIFNILYRTTEQLNTSIRTSSLFDTIELHSASTGSNILDTQQPHKLRVRITQTSKVCITAQAELFSHLRESFRGVEFNYKRISEPMAKEKYEILTNLSIKLFSKLHRTISRYALVLLKYIICSPSIVRTSTSAPAITQESWGSHLHT